MSWRVLMSYWSFEPLVLAALGVAGLVYWLGESRSAPRPAWRVLCFYAGLFTVFLALQSPLNGLDGRLFWVHMVQHLGLMMVASPLVILGDPVVPMLRAWPLRWRRRTLRLATTSVWSRRFGHLASQVAGPWTGAFILIFDLYLWHWSTLFNLALRNQAVHGVEHGAFMATAFLFWAQVIDQKAVHIGMSYLRRAGYVLLVGAAGNLLAMYFVFAPTTLYSAYTNLHPRPFGMGGLMDQQLAGALMWVPVLFVFATAFSVCLYRWLGAEGDVFKGAPTAVPSYRLLDGSLSSEGRTP